MNTIWNYIDDKNWSKDTKSTVILLILGIISALSGLLIWLVIRPWTLSSLDWLVCFMGYPVILSWYAAFLYSCTHELESSVYYPRFNN